MSSPSVPKPASAKDGVLSIAKTTSSFANIRSGPGTQYADIGDLFNNSAVTQYPQSNMGGWVWIEQPGSAGWISTSVVSFTPVNTQPANTAPTPYDGKIAIWHWKGTAIPETTIAQLAQNVRKNTPNVRQLWVKVGDGNAWQGKFDSGDMAINGPADIDRWVTTLGQHGLEFHAWVVLKGVDIQGEANIMIAVGQRPGVKSIIMDVEPYEGYWKAGPQPIRPLMTMVRQGLGNNFHIGLCIDPRKAHYETVYPNEWKPFVDSVHTMSYWRTFRKTVAVTLQETYQVWGGFGKPIIPILQGDAPLIEQQEAHMIATQQFKAKGLSWWRYGDTPQWAAVNTPIPGTTTSPPDTSGGITTDLTNTPPQGTAFAEEKVIFFGQAGHRSGTYTGQPEYKETSGAMTWKFSYTSTQETTSKVWSEWKTALPADGIYQISVFIPAKNATTKKARYKIHGIRGTNTEVVVDLNQSIYRNVWVSLGIFDLVKTQENAGKVFLNDVTGEKDREIAFDAVRVRRIVPIKTDGNNNNTNPNPGVPVADGFDSPVFESLADAQGTILWPQGWRDATGFGRKTAAAYISNNRAYHPGVDLNLGSWDQDRGKPVYATASGVVIFQGDMRIWGNVTVIRHDPLRTADGAIYYSRYGHMQNVTVKVGDRVKRGQKIGEVGKGFGNFAAHLHFDIVRTTALERYAGDWPGMDLARIERDYVDPLEFIRNNRPKR